MAKTSIPRQNWIITILKKQVVKQVVGEMQVNSKIVAIPNRYKDNLDDLINSSDTESLDWPKSIDKRSCNALKAESSSTELLEGDCLDKDISNRSSQMTLKTENSLVHQRYDVTSFGFKNKRS